MAKKDSFKEPIRKAKKKNTPVVSSGVTEDIFRQLSSSLDLSPGNMILADPQGQIRLVNKGLEVLSGFKPEEMIGQSMASFWAQPQETTQRMMAQLYSDQAWQGENQHKKKQGQPFCELASLSVILDEAGMINGFLKLGQDISDKKAEQEIHLLREQGSGAIIDPIDVGLIETDLRGVILYANDCAASIYRRPVKKLRALGFKDYMPQEEADKVSRLQNNMYRSREESKQVITYDVIGKDGSIVTCEAVVTFLKNVAGHPEGFGCFIRDITETKKMEAALKESE